MVRHSMTELGMGRRFMSGLGVLSPIGLAMALIACGDSSGGTGSGGAGGKAMLPCNESPFECKAGQTCWPNMSVTAFECLNSGAGKAGDACALIGGQVTCGDGLICIALTDPMKGQCTPYCDPTDPSHGCPNGEVCAGFGINSNALLIKACTEPTTTSSSSGSTSGSTASSTSSSSASSTSSDSSTASGSGSTGTGN
jgi:hypothetical protein